MPDASESFGRGPWNLSIRPRRQLALQCQGLGGVLQEELPAAAGPASPQPRSMRPSATRGDALPTRRSPLPFLPRLSAAATLVGATLLAGCGGGGDEDADPAKVAPQSTVVYLGGVLRPAGDQKEAVDEISRKVFRVADPGKRLQQEIDQSFKDDPDTRDVTWADDIEPWLGKRVAAAVTRLGSGNQSQVAVIFATKDAGKAKDALDRASRGDTTKPVERSYKGEDYLFDSGDALAAGVVGDYAVLANSEPAFRSVVDASQGKGLSEKPDFKPVAAEGGDKLGFGYIDVRSAIAALGASGAIPPGQDATLRSLAGNANKPVTMLLDAKTDRVALEVISRGLPPDTRVAQQAKLVQGLPGDAWLAFGIPQLGQSLRKATQQIASGGIGGGIVESLKQQVRSSTGLDVDRDVIAALGNVAFFAQGSNPLTAGGGMVVDSPDPAAARRLVSKLRPLLARQGASSGLRTSPANVAGAQGFRLSSPQIPGAVNVVVRGNRMVVAYGDAATRSAFSPAERLGDSPVYKAAAESLDGAQPGFFVSFGPVAELVGVSSSPQAQRARTYLSALKTLAVGGKVEGDTQTGRFVVTLK